jgi:uncharacterized protein (DUF58 family)
METSELLKKVRKIEIKTRGLSNQLFSGGYHSAFKGRGMSFSEVRDYQYGDDVRNIDWNVTARFNQPYVKVFEEERELTMMLVVDVSRSSYFGSTPQLKSELVTELCAVLAFSAINNNDKVGVILFSDKIEMFIPPKKGKSHILRIIRELIEFKPEQKETNIGLALEYLSNFLKKRSIVFLISDFIDFNYLKPLQIASKRHDLIGINIQDPRDASLPNVGIVNFYDAETGEERLIDTSNSFSRNSYSESYLKSFEQFQNSFAKCGSDKMTINMHENYITALLSFFKKRGHGA